VDDPGNVTPDAEFNIYVDPEALARVLDAGVRLDLVPLDATRQAVLERAALPAALAQAPRAQPGRIMRFTDGAPPVSSTPASRGSWTRRDSFTYS